MECVGTDCKQNARVVFVLEIKMQKLPCFASFWCSRVFEDWLARVSSLGNMQKLVQMFSKLGYNRYKSYVILES